MKIVKQSSFMFWDYFTGKLRKGDLYFLPKNMAQIGSEIASMPEGMLIINQLPKHVTIKAQYCTEVWESHLFNNMELHEASNFMHDEALCFNAILFSTKKKKYQCVGLA